MAKLISVSRVTSFPDKPFLVGWSSKITQQDYHETLAKKRQQVDEMMASGEVLPTLRELIDSFPADLKVANDITTRSKNIGILFHEAVQKTIESKGLTECLDVFYKANSDIAQGAINAYHNWFGWWKTFGPNGVIDENWTVSTEVDLMDEELGVQGRCDMVSACPIGNPRDGKENMILVDWKSSDDFYLADLLEVAAYFAMLAKQEKLASVNKAYIVRCSKDEIVEPRVIEMTREDAILGWSTFVSITKAVQKYDEFDARFGQKLMPKRGRK